VLTLGARRLRGVNADVIYIDEAAFIDNKLFGDVIVPITEMKQCVLIMISSPGKVRFYDRLMELRDSVTRLPIFNTFKLDLVCPRCRRKSDPSRCTHRVSWIPSWKSRNKQEIAKAIYGEDDQDSYTRESMGLSGEDRSGWFNRSALNFLRVRIPWKPDTRAMARRVVITCDPNAHGALSRNAMAYVAMVRDDDTDEFVVRFVYGRNTQHAAMQLLGQTRTSHKWNGGSKGGDCFAYGKTVPPSKSNSAARSWSARRSSAMNAGDTSCGGRQTPHASTYSLRSALVKPATVSLPTSSDSKRAAVCVERKRKKGPGATSGACVRKKLRIGSSRCRPAKSSACCAVREPARAMPSR
jgi:hypothetical protein